MEGFRCKLIDAATEDDLSFIQKSKEEGLDIHMDDYAAFRKAAERGSIEVVKYLLDNGADIHIYQDVALIDAATSIRRSLETVKYLVENGANIHANSDLALRRAMNCKYFDVVKYLLENGADVHCLHDWILKHSAARGYYDFAKYLIDNFYDITKDDNTDYGEVLENAAMNGNTDIVRLLVEKGVSPKSFDGALVEASMYGCLQVVKYLTSKGANLHARNDEALKVAKKEGHGEIEIFLEEEIRIQDHNFILSKKIVL